MISPRNGRLYITKANVYPNGNNPKEDSNKLLAHPINKTLPEYATVKVIPYPQKRKGRDISFSNLYNLTQLKNQTKAADIPVVALKVKVNTK